MIWRARLVVPVLVGLAVGIGILIWLFTATTDKGSRSRVTLPSSHPIFGEIHEASATDVSELPDVQGPTGPRPKPPVFLVLGIICWSGPGFRHGLVRPVLLSRQCSR